MEIKHNRDDKFVTIKLSNVVDAVIRKSKPKWDRKKIKKDFNK